MTDAIQTIKDSLIFLANRCDGARGQDGVGFNGGDSQFGKDLAAKVRLDNKLSKKQLETAQMMLVKYTRQLAEGGLKVPTFGELATAMSLQIANKKVVVTATPRATTPPASTKTVTYNQKTNKLEVRFDFSYDTVALVKSIEPKGKFDGAFKKWDFNLSSLSDLVAKLQPNGFILDAGVMNQLHNLEGVASLSNERLELISRYLVSDASTWRVTPFKHQWEASRFIASQTDLRGIIADEMGLGKSLAALMVAKGIKAYYEMMGEIVEILIICPASLTRNWKIEASKIGLDAGVSIYSYNKIPPASSNKYLVIADEFHYCQSIGSLRTKNLISLSSDDNCISLIGLTGTPMNNGRPSNLYPLLKMINHPIAANKSAYDVRYCDAKSTYFCKWDTSGAINLDELNERIKTKVIRRLKTDCLDLPQKLQIAITCDDNSDAEKEYQSEFKRVVKEYKERVKAGKINGNSEALVMLGQLRKLSSMYKRYEAIKRAEELLEMNHPVVIFTQFVNTAKAISEHFNVECLTGETPTQKTIKGEKVYPRQQMVENFQSGKTKVFVSTIEAGGVGITLTRANHLIMVDLPYTVGSYQQATDRIHRIGAEGLLTEDGNKAVSIYTLYAKPVDYAVSAMLQRKTEIVEAVLADCKITDIDDMGDLISKLIKAK